MENNVLLILASGKSSRFGGYPKAFCRIGDEIVVQRTIDYGNRYYNKTYLAINREIYPDYNDLVEGCKILAIGTGQGDSHSFLRALRLICEECEADKVTLCWGDTFYFDDVVFKKAYETEVGSDCVGVSFSSIDLEPYAWYKTENDIIIASCFRSLDGLVESGIHDQSVFVFRTKEIISQLEKYMELLGINDEEDYINKDVSKEMRLLDSFTFFFNNGLLPMRYVLIKPGTCCSFNTQEELEKVRNLVEKQKGSANV